MEARDCHTSMLGSNPTMHVIGPFRLNTAQGLQPQSRISGSLPTSGVGNGAGTRMESPASPASSPDQLDLSPEARAASGVGGIARPATVGGDMRLDKIADIRRQIAAGTYDTPEKFEQAFGKMLDSLG